MSERHFVRHLGICEDGPLEPQRITFEKKPELGDQVLVRKELDYGTPLKKIDGLWREIRPGHTYRVNEIRDDGFGTVSRLTHIR